ncbi:PhzF family phenazine biosynthesis protein [Gordonia sp. X0973]|uniref:PhzF family phenazine biosynthesis protein n=1 Tax=Gordonia sp. X0973 TaxID=2742602 RepID=UPI000F5481F1|nr:PhzF family phenazine biosynthesis protein [Gordonia sp. X0973]QKT06484.1 PhzF family phenazine biosynthesis protein [Gordonia sp. X0973]
MQRPFAQVDVFTDRPTAGNPVAVVCDGDGLDDATMAAFARWTNLSETTFVQTPIEPAADYRLRIFTPTGELPFAGHPTLGSAHAWLERSGTTRRQIVQECGIGLVEIRRDGERLAFAAPDLRRGGPVEDHVLDRVVAALRLSPEQVIGADWVDNGPPWIGVRLASAQDVLDLRPDNESLGALMVGVVGAYPDGGGPDGAAVEVRAFAPGVGVPEDPVTGSLNAGLAKWLRAAGHVPSRYVASQGTALGRAGRVFVHDDDTDIWIGGQSVTVVSGTVEL